MRIIFILLLACLLNQHITAQVESPRKQLPQKEVKEGQPSKKQIQAEMVSAINEIPRSLTWKNNWQKQSRIKKMKKQLKSCEIK